MLRPERPPSAAQKPIGAPWGNNQVFQRLPNFRRSKKQPGQLDRALPWREGDNRLFLEVVTWPSQPDSSGKNSGSENRRFPSPTGGKHPAAERESGLEKHREA